MPTMEMTSPSEPTATDEPIETGDLTMATFLVVHGVKPTLMRRGETGRGHPIGAWQFAATEKVRDLVEEFEDGRARVEPQAFHRELTRTRSKLLDWLGVPRG